MKITYLQNAGVIIENFGEKILCDPWLVDGCYYGSWYHYPKYDFDPKNFDDINYIYISHIHPDHFDINTLTQLKKDIPVLIHEFPQKYFKKNIENLGFDVLELSNNKRTKLGKTWINIIAADNCDPEICSRSFGCNFGFNQFGTNQIDTFSIIDNEKQVIVNSNDCPFEIGSSTVKMIKKQYPDVDLFLVGYTGASDYPCNYDLEPLEKKSEAERKKSKRLQNAVDYINLLDPKYYLPFAGRYVLGGKLVSLMKNKGESTLDEGINFLKENIDQEQNKGIALNINSEFDLDSEQFSESYVPENKYERDLYIQNVLAKKKLDYEHDSFPTLDSIMKLISKAYDRFEHHRKMIDYSTDTVILIKLFDDNLLFIPLNGDGFKIIELSTIKNFKKYIYLSLDMRLFFNLLRGPKFAHWNNAEIGCHITWKRIPNIYDKSLTYCLNFFHS